MRIWLVACVVAGALLPQAGRAAPAAPDRDAAAPSSVREPWFRPPPANSFDQWIRVDPLRVYEVHPVMLPKARALLKRRPVVELTLAQAQTMVEKKLVVPPGMKPRLVRALYSGPELTYLLGVSSDRFRVYQRGTGLWVDYATVGLRSTPVMRAALILFLDRRPHHLYVTSEVEE